MTNHSLQSPAQARKKDQYRSRALLSALLLSEIIHGGHAFSLPIGLTSVQRIADRQHLKSYDHLTNISSRHKNARNLLFAGQYYNNEDQWGDDEDFAYWQQQSNTNDAAFLEFDQQSFEGAKRALVGGAALGTMMAINNAMGMSAGAETATIPESGGEISQQSVESYSAVVNSQPEVTLPYLEEKIQAAEEEAFGNQAYSYETSAPVLASAAETTDNLAPVPEATSAMSETVVASVQPTTDANMAAASTSETNAAFAPSFIRYTQDHMPGWIETGHRIYDAAAPKIIAGGEKIAAEVDKRVTPVIIEKEHELLGDENSAVLDKALSGVASAGKMVAGMMGKAISLGIQGGVQVAKATPEVIAAGQKVYKTMDEKIMPELVESSRKMKMIVDKTVPEVVETGMHTYDTIMPEVMNAEKQVASAVKTGMDVVMPKLQEIENKVRPELTKMEYDILGEERAVMVEKTVAEVAQQGQGALKTVEKTIPKVVSSGQQTIGSVAYTGRTVARAVPVIVEAGKQAYGTVDRSVSGAISTTQDIANDLDRAAGKTAYALESNLNGMAGTLDKTLPTLLEVGRQVAVSGSEIAKTVETGGKAVYNDVSGFVDDLQVDKTIDSAAKRFAATKPTRSYQEITASVNDPNQMGKL